MDKLIILKYIANRGIVIESSFDSENKIITIKEKNYKTTQKRYIINVDKNKFERL